MNYQNSLNNFEEHEIGLQGENKTHGIWVELPHDDGHVVNFCMNRFGRH